MDWFKQRRWVGGLTGSLMVLVLVGCKRQNDQVYYAPKESQQQTDTTTSPDAATVGQAPNRAALPTLNYTLPDGWHKKAPTRMRVASFTATGKDGQSADVSVIPLPIVGHEQELVNMWRQQLDLSPTSQANADQLAAPILIGGQAGKLFDFSSRKPLIDGKYRARILVAMLTRGQMSWFFKMSGEAAFVASEKPTFLHFLKSASFGPAPAGLVHSQDSGQGAAEDTGSAQTPAWTVPAGWQAVPPAQFLAAEYTIAGPNGAKADADAAVLNGDGGGVLANVNRWRGQLGLAPTTANNLATMTQSLAVPGGQATLVDLTGKDPGTGKATRLIGVILPQAGQTWFYRLLGDQHLVTQQKAAFLQFIRSAKYD